MGRTNGHGSERSEDKVLRQNGTYQLAGDKAQRLCSMERKQEPVGEIPDKQGPESSPKEKVRCFPSDSPWGFIRGSNSVHTSRVPKKFVFIVTSA